MELPFPPSVGMELRLRFSRERDAEGIERAVCSSRLKPGCVEITAKIVGILCGLGSDEDCVEVCLAPFSPGTVRRLALLEGVA